MIRSTLTPEQAREAGEYLITKGQHCVRIGTRLLTLAEMGWISRAPPLQPAQAEARWLFLPAVMRA